MTTLQGWVQQFRHSDDIKSFGSKMTLHGTHKAFSFRCFDANGCGFGADSTNKRKVGSFNAPFPSLFPSICSILHVWQALVWVQRQKWNYLPTRVEILNSVKFQWWSCTSCPVIRKANLHCIWRNWSLWLSVMSSLFFQIKSKRRPKDVAEEPR